MDEFVKNRITQLRIKKGISEYQMSYDLGHSRGYHPWHSPLEYIYNYK